MSKAEKDGPPLGSTNPEFKLTVGQAAQLNMVGTDALHCMSYGGAGSSKTFGIIGIIILRAIAVPHRSLIVRRHFKHARQFVAMQTFPEVMSVIYPGVEYNLNKGEWYVTFPHNESEIWFGGLDDGKRMDKVLGPQYATIFINECSEIMDFNSVVLLRTRLRQKTALRPKMFYDQNPPTKAHWTYKEFELGINPLSREELVPDHDVDYRSLLMNPEMNWLNMADGYKKTLEAMPERHKRRFLYGQYADEVEDALWKMSTIDEYRINPDQIPELVRIVVAVDPSVTGNPDSDECGIVVAGKCREGHYYLLDDLSLKAHPKVWGEIVVNAYHKWKADCIVGEVNNGGDLVELNIRNSKGGDMVAYEAVRASRGKITRAEPVAALYERGMCHHAGTFRHLEDELTTYNPDTAVISPGRMDAVTWAMIQLAGMDANEDNIQSILENCVMT